MTASQTATKDTVAAVSITSVTSLIDQAQPDEHQHLGHDRGRRHGLGDGQRRNHDHRPVSGHGGRLGELDGDRHQRQQSDDGSITYTATATDAVGNTGTATTTATKDTVAPTVAVTR